MPNCLVPNCPRCTLVGVSVGGCHILEKELVNVANGGGECRILLKEAIANQ